jgi:hypothetical protein
MPPSSGKQYIQKSHSLIKEYTIGDMAFVVKHNVTGNINFNNVIQILKKIPLPIIQTVDAIYIGEFSFLKKRQVDALFDERTIYVSNDQENEQQLLKNIVHEFAHGCEEAYYRDIYEDGAIKEEFLKKRIRMFEILEAYGFNKIPKESFLNPEYNENFDLFLYKTVGYDKLNSLTSGIYLSPYAATSLREYFANGFEKYFLENSQEVERISPALYQKLILFSQKPV